MVWPTDPMFRVLVSEVAAQIEDLSNPERHYTVGLLAFAADSPMGRPCYSLLRELSKTNVVVRRSKHGIRHWLTTGPLEVALDVAVYTVAKQLRVARKKVLATQVCEADGDFPRFYTLADAERFATDVRAYARDAIQSHYSQLDPWVVSALEAGWSPARRTLLSHETY